MLKELDALKDELGRASRTKFRPGKVYKFAALPIGCTFRLALDGRHGWLKLRERDSNLSPGNYIKLTEATYTHESGGNARTAPRGFTVEFIAC